jgi:SAM-dependent methyltransferase
MLWDRFGILSFEMLYPKEYYKTMLREAALRDAEQFGDVIQQEFNPSSIIDFGCGSGRFLMPFHNRGVDVHGVDASEDAIEESPIPDEHLEVYDLRQEYESDADYDVALCIEVLEHLPERAADNIIKTIASHAPIAVVTAAKPGDSGRHHINEQPRSYWIKKFDEQGMNYNEQIVEQIRNKMDTEELHWLEENLMIFVRDI